MKIDRIDHLVLAVRDVERACAFYQSVPGLEVVTFGQGRRALKFGSRKLNPHQQGTEFEPKAFVPTPGAIGNLLSVDVRDPNHNLIEIANYIHEG